jgi:hypothetical protein
MNFSAAEQPFRGYLFYRERKSGGFVMSAWETVYEKNRVIKGSLR